MRKVGAVSLPVPACDEWSPMWGENQHAHFREAKTNQNYFYKAIKWKGCVSGFVSFFAAQRREGPDYVTGHEMLGKRWRVVRNGRGSLRPVVGESATSGPSRNPTPHCSVHNAAALRASCGTSEREHPFSWLEVYPLRLQILTSLSPNTEAVSRHFTSVGFSPQAVLHKCAFVD